MNKKRIREKFIEITGYWTYKKAVLPVGADVIVDLKGKIGAKPDTIFDVGANIGQTALTFNKHFPKATIHSFEPIASTYKQLENNVKAYSNIKCHKLALSDKSEELKIRIFEGKNSVLNSLNTISMNITDNSKEEIITTNTLDNFLEEQKLTTIDLLKIDTEGYEMPVLKGASHALQNNKIKMIYLEVGFSKRNDMNTYLPEVLEFLTDLQFVMFGLYELHHFNIETEHHFGNALFLHKSVVKNNNYY